MPKYIQLTDEQCRTARLTDLVSFLRSRGETLTRSGSEFAWQSHSGKVTIRGNLWYDQYERIGGDAIDFAKRFYNKSYPEAVIFLLEGGSCSLSNSPEQRRETKQFIIPERNDNSNRVTTYLTVNRGIDINILNDFIRDEMIYESKKHHNAVFVGYDKNGLPRHANMRGIGSKSTYKCNAVGSIPDYSFHRYGNSSSIYLFEAPIDMLSYITMHQDNWQEHSYASACSVSDKVLFKCLKDNPNLNQVYICFDNDEPGQLAAKRIKNKLTEMNISSQILVPSLKDWNEDLLFLKKRGHLWQE